MKYCHLFFLVPMLYFSVSTFGQTYYYTFDYKIDPDTGVKMALNSSPVYITFTNNKGICYQSDSGGEQLPTYNREEALGKEGFTGKHAELVESFYGFLTTNYYLIWRKCDGLFRFYGTENSKHNYRLYYYDYYNTYRGEQKYDDGYLYISFSTDFQTIYVQDGGYINIGKKTTPPGKAAPPSEMW